jgi:Na+-transporting NADH:ubiquinone oxidoreductase subunit NqrC
MPRLWAIMLVILVACLVASMVIAIVKLSAG